MLGSLEGDPGAGPPGTCPCSGPSSSRSPALGTDRCPRRGGACVRCVGAGEGPDRAAGWRRGTRAAHFVFLLLELLLQVELLCLQVVDALPELLGLLPARATAGVRGTAGSKDGPSASIPILTQPPGAPALLPACPPAEGPPFPRPGPAQHGAQMAVPGAQDPMPGAARARFWGHGGQGGGLQPCRASRSTPFPHLCAGTKVKPESRLLLYSTARWEVAAAAATHRRPRPWPRPTPQNVRGGTAPWWRRQRCTPADALPGHNPRLPDASPTSAGLRSGGRWPAPSFSRPESSSSFPALSASSRFSAPSGVDSKQGELASAGDSNPQAVDPAGPRPHSWR